MPATSRRARGRRNGFGVAHAIQTDAAINPGNSGGPLVDANVVGVVDQIVTASSVHQSAGVGFAVPSDIVAAELRALARGRRVTHTYVGVSTSDAASGGALVESVAWDGPAARAGVRTGDVVTALAGTAVRASGDFVAAVAARVRCTACRQPDQALVVGADPPGGALSRSGLSCRSHPPSERVGGDDGV